jgi:hypothetical protein
VRLVGGAMVGFDCYLRYMLLNWRMVEMAWGFCPDKGGFAEFLRVFAW